MNNNFVNWVYTYDSIVTAPLVRYNYGESDLHTSNLPTISWSNSQLCSDKEHPLSEQYEDEEGNLVMRVALAGYPRENISVAYTDNILVIRASKVEDEHKSLSIAKRACSKDFVDSKGIWDFASLKAVYKDGLLTITAPKKKEKRPVMVVVE